MPYKDPIKQAQAEHESYLRNKKKINKRSNKRRIEKKKWFRDKIMPQYNCVRCGENDPTCLDFHHINPKTKDSTISRMLCNNHTKETILNEITKCIVFCANCHRKFHAGKFKWTPMQDSNPQPFRSKRNALYS